MNHTGVKERVSNLSSGISEEAVVQITTLW